MLIRLVHLVVLLGMVGCSTATYIRASVTENPLEQVAQQAQKEWSVERVDANTLEISDAWPLHSLLSIGYTQSHADLIYDPSASVLNIRYYVQSNQLLLLFIPFYLDAEPGFVGGGLKPTMNAQINKILGWSGAITQTRRAGAQSDKFPPTDTTHP